ncbi:FHA domain containing protein [Catenulispora acidiphila DSM 44928]|jgi:pSer/pThr/pTyr-binding forkhead associated (FHA) protein|uniref:FHA domain containing protein n=1 Tax=Catenulispora acidiphila (strain DSM 44928 / JCM 14897 / NBRC 102108 / NRRL B-24433 / ID139908) TaxID=479433 RepID=C7QFQ0_CATAD|nr:FHA domain-containing protein [Catenulispora acidiphila]ACU68989.1 FHA domain containing protein [Catenulispora acidiphila DSM 44928]
MSQLTLTVIRLAFLVLLWLFVFSAVGVMRSDLYGSRTSKRQQAKAAKAAAAATQQVPARGGARQQPYNPGARRSGPPAPTRLVVVGGSLAGTTVNITSGQQVTMGRAHDSTIVLDDDYASSRHARLYPDASGQWIVEDLGSTNGTFLGQTKLNAPTVAQIGVPIRIGKTVLELRA